MPEDTREQEINKTVGTVIDVLCTECKRETKHEVLASVDINGTDCFNGGYHSIDYWVHNQILQCRGCETISFRSCSSNSQDCDFSEDGTSYYIETVTLYPNRTEGRVPLKDAYMLPTTVQRIYTESVKAMNNDQPVLAGVGIRALVETVCKDKKAKGRDLAQRIDSLVSLGLLTPDGSKILHKIRTLGNKAAHEVKPHKPELLGLALDVCEHLLQGVYILPKQAKRLPAGRLLK